VKRRIVQFISFLGLHSAWVGELKWLCNPVLSCHSCALAWFACPIGVFVHYSGYRIFPFFAIGTVLLVAVLMGRLLCGWVCPFGFLQDLLHKIPSPKFRLPKRAEWVKYGILVLGVFAMPFFFGELTRWSFCRFCPASALQVTVPGLVAGGVSFSVWTGVKLALLAAVLLLAVMSSRSFCKMLCPIGAFLAPLNHVSFWRVRPPTDACISCGRCDKACPTDVAPMQRIREHVPPSRNADCVVCHGCQPVCPVGRGKRESSPGEEKTVPVDGNAAPAGE
jgi:polyferredoxin